MELSPILISLKTSVVSIFFTFFLGIWAARAVVGLKSSRMKILLDGVLTLPLVLPPTVAGFFLLYLFGVKRPVGSLLLKLFDYKLVFTWQATVLAAVVISFPLMYRSARGAFELVDVNVLYAARTLGIPERKVFWKILLPMALPGVVSGGVLAFARGLGEFGATAMIAGNIAGKTRTLPLAIYSEVAAGNMEMAGQYVAVIAAISLFIVTGMNLVQRCISSASYSTCSFRQRCVAEASRSAHYAVASAPCADANIRHSIMRNLRNAVLAVFKKET